MFYLVVIPVSVICWLISSVNKHYFGINVFIRCKYQLVNISFVFNPHVFIQWINGSIQSSYVCTVSLSSNVSANPIILFPFIWRFAIIWFSSSNRRCFWASKLLLTSISLKNFLFILLRQCFSTPSPRTHLSSRKSLGESASTRGKQVFCNALTQ